MTDITITEADREAAAGHVRSLTKDPLELLAADWIEAGRSDDAPLVQLLARHRVGGGTPAQKDRRAASIILKTWGDGSPETCRLIEAGEWDEHNLVEMLRYHRLSAIEEAAKECEAYSRGPESQRPHGTAMAAHIRALAQPPVAKDIRKMREGN